VKIIPELINYTGNALVSGEVFDAIKQAVANVDTSDLSNDKKHQTVFNYIRAASIPIGKFALNFGIKLAVMWLRKRSQ